MSFKNFVIDEVIDRLDDWIGFKGDIDDFKNGIFAEENQNESFCQNNEEAKNLISKYEYELIELSENCEYLSPKEIVNMILNPDSFLTLMVLVKYDDIIYSCSTFQDLDSEIKLTQEIINNLKTDLENQRGII